MISPNLDEQIQFLLDEGIHFIDLRTVWGIPILELCNKQLVEIQQKLKAANIYVSCLSTFTGKKGTDSFRDIIRIEQLLVLFEVGDIKIHSEVLTGERVADWPATLACLQAAGYGGTLTLWGPRQPLSGPASVRAAYKALVVLLEELHWEYC